MMSTASCLAKCSLPLKSQLYGILGSTGPAINVLDGQLIDI